MQLCVCVYVCANMCAHVQMSEVYGACVGVKGQPQVSIFDFHLVWDRVFVLLFYIFFNHTIWWASFQGLCPLPSPCKDAGIIDICTT